MDDERLFFALVVALCLAALLIGAGLSNKHELELKRLEIEKIEKVHSIGE